MKTYIKALTTLLLLTLALPALAADPTPRPTPIRKASGFDTSVPLTCTGGGDCTCTFSYSVAGGAMSLNDTLGLCKLPKGAVVEAWMLYMPAQGTAQVVSLGTQESAAAYATASTMGAAETVASSMDAATNGIVKDALPAAALAADTYLVLKTTTAATTPNLTVGTIKGWVRYHTRLGF